MTLLKTKIGAIDFNHCLMNASGPLCTTNEELLNLLQSPYTGAVITKSTTLQYRQGNPEPRYQAIPHGSINSMGLPNNGIDYYIDFITKHYNKDKPFFISVAGLSLQENIDILKLIRQANIEHSGVELNLSCPNVPNKPQVGYDFEATEKYLNAAFEIYNKPLGIKLPPYFDMVHFDIMANIINKFPIAFITCINSVGNALFIDADKESVVIKPKNGFGGLGGLYVKPTALANVRRFYELLPHIPIVACGGVQNGMDVFEHILCGASVVQLGTVFMEENIAAFERISNEFTFIIKQKKYTDIQTFKGQLKTL